MAVEVVASAEVFLAYGEDEQQRILLLEHGYDRGTGYPLYDLPGGKLETGESGLEAVVRGARQQTGLELDPEQLVRFSASTEVPRRQVYGRPEEMIGHVVVREFFLGRLHASPQGVPLREHDGGYWVPHERLFTLPGVRIEHKSAYQRVKDFRLWDLVKGYAA